MHSCFSVSDIEFQALTDGGVATCHFLALFCQLIFNRVGSKGTFWEIPYFRQRASELGRCKCQSWNFHKRAEHENYVFHGVPYGEKKTLGQQPASHFCLNPPFRFPLNCAHVSPTLRARQFLLTSFHSASHVNGVTRKWWTLSNGAVSESGPLAAHPKCHVGNLSSSWYLFWLPP